MKTVLEKARQIPEVWEGDVCVLGGSCTGVFAAVRAARLGAKVALIEKQNCFGGMATAGLVNIWHSMFDFDFKERIVAGLSQEIIDRLTARGQARTVSINSCANRFNPMALIHELDLLVQSEPRIHPFLHTFYAGAETDGDAVDCVYIQNKDGRSAIRARFFIDATGDGDLMRDLNCPRYYNGHIQPPSTCFLLKGSTSERLIRHLITEHGAEVGLDDDWGWFGPVPGLDGITFRADNHVFGFDLSRADDLTQAEFEGRRRAYALEALLKKYASEDFSIVNMSASIGIRETAHYVTRYTASESDLLLGRRFDDAVMQGTYCLDVHHSEDNGITFKHLDGKKLTVYGKNSKYVEGNWRKELGLDDNYAKFYQVPFSILVQEQWKNVIPAGRMVNADGSAFGALRVMINTNQLGEAAGVAAALCLDDQADVRMLDGRLVRETLKKGGSAL